jgi:histidyl-tRNA synthetase
MKSLKDNCYKGTQIILGNKKRILINSMINTLIQENFVEISFPIIQLTENFENKVGDENRNMMFTFTDRGERNVCIAPEYTALVQKLALDRFKYEKNMKLFYVQQCFRGEAPQAGRYREFTQLGIEILNPTQDYSGYLKDLAVKLLDGIPGVFELNSDVTRGLDYYENGKGFEIKCDSLGSSKQVCGGGAYQGGIGFALGIDRLLLI